MKMVPLSRFSKSGNQAESGGFAAAAFAHDDEKFARVNIEVGLIDGGDSAKLFRDST